MPLEVPDLDDRSFEELVTDARKRIPVHSPEWTDHNESDPGITMLEVLAWVAESDIYELDQVTDAHVRKYLRLLGVVPEPPRAASVTVSLDPPGSLEGDVLPEGTALAVDDVGTTRTFETASALGLTAASVAAVVSETTEGQVDLTRANAGTDLHFQPFGSAAAEGSAVYLGFDADPFDAGRLDLDVDFHEADLPTPAEHGDEASMLDPSATIAWEYCVDFDEFYASGSWRSVPTEQDDTGQLYHGGTVSLAKPDDWDAEATDWILFDVDDPLFWLRARVDVPGHEVPPQLDAFATNVVEVRHRHRIEDEPLGRVQEGSSVAAARRRLHEDGSDVSLTTAQPDQTFAFPDAPVLDAEVTVGGTPWKLVTDLDASGPDAEHCVLDHERGAVRFGDGVRGEVPEPDQEVRATWYVHGGGEAGNVAREATWRFADEPWTDVGVAPRGSVTGGIDAEPTDAALARLKADLRTPYRAVTESDFVHVATHTPGLRFGRAAVDVHREDDAGDDCATHGEVTVAVVPYSTRERPVPSEGFLDAVDCHLQRHRLLTDEVSVVAPTYVAIDVDATIEAADGYSADARTAAVGETLETFLDPLEGFDGDGWPFGRSVYRSEVYETIEGVEGVDCVNDVELRAAPPGTPDATGIDIPGTALVYLDDATITAVDAGGNRCGGWSR